MASRVVTVAALLLLVALAGCSGTGGESTTRSTLTAAPVPTDGTPDQVVTAATPTPTATTRTPSTTVARLDPYTDSGLRRIFRRLTDILRIATARPAVERHAVERIEAGAEPVTVPHGVGDVLGVPTRSTAGTPVGRIDGETVHLVVAGTNVSTREYNLAYLYARYVQESVGWTETLSAHRNGTLDEQLVAAALTRGGAAFTADQYATVYALSVDRPARTWAYDWWSSPWLGRAVVDAGYEHVSGSASIPSGVRWVFHEPPRTTEQLLHGYSPKTDPVAPLSVSVAATGDWRRLGSDRFGELGIRALLATRLPASTAAEGASGWGNDRLLTFERGNETALVWVTTWDRSGKASSFATAIDQYAAGDPPTAHAVERLDERTVVLVAGSRGFVAGTDVRGGNRTVRVSLPG